MSGSFGGLSTALSGLYAQRRGLEVAGQNIANANTEGYSRQRLVLIVRGGARPAGHLRHGRSDRRWGAQLAEVTRMRDEFLEARARAEHASSEFVPHGKKEILRQDRAGDRGTERHRDPVAAVRVLGRLAASLTNRPATPPPGLNCWQRGTTLTDSIRSSYTSVTSLWDVHPGSDSTRTSPRSTRQPDTSPSSTRRSSAPSRQGCQPTSWRTNGTWLCCSWAS